MKDTKVIITADRIQLAEPKNYLNNGIVMDKVAKPITEKFCEVVGETRGHILDVGFGLGYSAQYFYEMGVKSYTCIEINEQVYEKALEWAKNKQNINIILGDWIDIIPTLTSKYDGIFMDTYGDSYSKYALFESTCQEIAEENCILSLYEYEQIENPVYLNRRMYKWEQGDYELKLKQGHSVCWKYFVGGKFRKEKYYEELPLLPSSIIDEILNQDIKFETVEDEALVKGKLHKAKYKAAHLNYNKELLSYINRLYPEYSDLSFGELRAVCLVKYDEGDFYDKHIETLKGVPLQSPEQNRDLIIIQLTENYTGGRTLIHDNWLRSKAVNYSPIKKKRGYAIKFKPYQHSTSEIVTDGTKLELVIMLTNGSLVRKPKNII